MKTCYANANNAEVWLFIRYEVVNYRFSLII